ncbi:hypothetical protein NW762_011642 [Fusarium torreyae]|uniref:Uncharacterized protein n=1 Tax=Fusarium torreyae TaxID=1237075 RepID=A0A9W8V944_9HYPO|nr:hypothetical protein NW762_011642 [Fusarium torreyae]
MPLMRTWDHLDRLGNLPSDIEGCSLTLRFNNGPLRNSERGRRKVQPKPKFLDGEISDDTDYIKLNNNWDSSPKGEERRLICSFHCWEPHVDKYPTRFGKTDVDSRNTFRVLQGDKSGSAVGFVCERSGGSDIALAKLNDGIVFENKFMEMDAAPKKFLRSEEQNMGDHYMFDSFATGKQRVAGFGRCFTMGWTQDEPHHHLIVPQHGAHLMPVDEVKYIALEQGAYVTNSPEIIGKPQTRDSVCGSVLLRCKAKNHKRKNQPQKTLDEGGIGGMLHFCDLQFKNSSRADSFILYADSFDPLIDDNWTIVQDTLEDKVLTGQGEEQGSPSKKQKTMITD